MSFLETALSWWKGVALMKLERNVTQSHGKDLIILFDLIV